MNLNIHPDNIVDLQAAVCQAIVQELRPLRGRNDFSGITIYTYDPIYANALSGETFIEQLRLRFDAELFYTLGSGTVVVEPSPANLPSAAIAVLDSKISFVLHQKGSVPTMHRAATIAVVDGTGSLQQSAYHLTPEADAVYCIGRGRLSRKYGEMRQNDIIIRDDDPDPAVQRQNNAVSSAHADIVVRQGKYYLQAKPSGCRPEGGTATKIIRRHEPPIELRTSRMLYLLQPDDIIELGKSVCLSFTM